MSGPASEAMRRLTAPVSGLRLAVTYEGIGLGRALGSGAMKLPRDWATKPKVRVEVEYDGGQWVVLIDGEPLALCDTRGEAVDLGRFTARSQRPAELVIRFRNGKAFKVHGYPAPRAEGVRKEREEMWRNLSNHARVGKPGVE